MSTAARSSTDNLLCVDVAGWVEIDFASPRLFEMVNSLQPVHEAERGGLRLGARAVHALAHKQVDGHERPPSVICFTARS
ncbi:hypothetical protein GCM10025876_16030 [Demequina litorisediminis]|uniref:STAS domain-containing protein n=1 Tax=Demequina litorisediminis TaxID=1849022 RepID=A0ABQ6IF85_9MICO|nr:hypothetical protein GCM10025876_16030 [Demequina litorisediminis]